MQHWTIRLIPENIIKANAFVLGFVATIAQILILRESIVAFGSQEFYYGLTLACWLFYIGLGSKLTGLFRSISFRQIAFLNLLTIPCLFSSLFLLRLIHLLKNILNIVPESTFAPDYVLAFSLFIILPLCLVSGLQFSWLSKLVSSKNKKDLRPLNEIYFLEAGGAVSGAILFNFVLLFTLSPFEIIGLLTILLFFLALALYRVAAKKQQLNVLPLAIFLVIIALLCPALEIKSQKIVYLVYKVVKISESPYGRLAVVRNQTDTVIFRNADLIYASSFKPLTEENIHLPLLACPRQPKKVLLLNSNFDQIKEVLKYSSLKHLDYLEPDKKLIILNKKYLSDNSLLKNRYLHFFTQDPQQYLRTTTVNYDVIISGLTSPETLLANHYYSYEFFVNCRKHLAKDGLLAILVPYTENYLGRPSTTLNKIIAKTFQQVFPNAVIWPGIYNHLVGTNANNPLTLNKQLIINKMNKYNIRNTFFNPEAIEYLFTPEKITQVQTLLQPGPGAINRNLKPAAYFAEQIFWLSYFNSPSQKILIKFFAKLIYLAGIILTALTLSLKIFRRLSKFYPPLIIFFIGSLAMLLQTTLLYLFQLIYGSLYYYIGILIASFMCGLLWGSYQSKSQKKIKHSLEREVAVLYLPSLLLLLIIFNQLARLTITQGLVVFGFCSFLAGYPVGRTYFIGLQEQQKYRQEPGHLVALIYSASTWGGALATFVATVFFLPILGFVGTIILDLILLIATAILSFKY